LKLRLMLARIVSCSISALVPAVQPYCAFLLTVFVNALLAALLSLADIVYSLHIGYFPWYNTCFGVIYILCLIDVYCTQTKLSPQDTHTHVTSPVALERPRRPLATDSRFTVRANDWTASASRVPVRTRGLTFGSRTWLFFPSRVTCCGCRCRPVGRLVRHCCVLASFLVVLHCPFAHRAVPFE